MPRRLLCCALLLTLAPNPLATQEEAAPSLDTFFAITEPDDARAAAARARLAANWRDGYAAIVVDLLDLIRRTSFVNPIGWLRLSRTAQFLEQQTGQSFGVDVDAWRRWVWSLPYDPHPEYGRFKGQLYGTLDPRFEAFFPSGVESGIRLDEVQWGGVAVNGIPPLNHPTHVPAAGAAYLDDGDIVFGIATGGQARAYPKRILAWHELALDALGGRELAVVYCTLCGTVIPYDVAAGGRRYTFGTSGLLYQSNKLMFDHETMSLWSSLEGRPVIGPLAGTDVRLSFVPVVTTTWGEWRTARPETTVLSLETGYQRDYSEGAAYRQYFSSDALMFDVSRHDPRLPNKAEILALRQDRPGAPPLAIAARFLEARPVYHPEGVEPGVVIITSPDGANRVYRSGARRFVQIDREGHAIDRQGLAWVVEEDALVATGDPERRLPRVPAHRAFWFAWYAQHPETRLIR